MTLPRYVLLPPPPQNPALASFLALFTPKLWPPSTQSPPGQGGALSGAGYACPVQGWRRMREGGVRSRESLLWGLGPEWALSCAHPNWTRAERVQAWPGPQRDLSPLVSVPAMSSVVQPLWAWQGRPPSPGQAVCCPAVPTPVLLPAQASPQGFLWGSLSGRPGLVLGSDPWPSPCLVHPDRHPPGSERPSPSRAGSLLSAPTNCPEQEVPPFRPLGEGTTEPLPSPIFLAQFWKLSSAKEI